MPERFDLMAVGGGPAGYLMTRKYKSPSDRAEATCRIDCEWLAERDGAPPSRAGGRFFTSEVLMKRAAAKINAAAPDLMASCSFFQAHGRGSAR